MNELNQLDHLARLYNVRRVYYGVGHKRITASPDSLLMVLKSLGAPLNKLGDVPSAIREKELSINRRVIEPVIVAWDGKHPEIIITVPLEMAGLTFSGYLSLESGEKFNWKWRSSDLRVVRSRVVEKQRFVTYKVTLSLKLPFGYHKFLLDIAGKEDETLIISSPRRSFSTPDAERDWGAFLPLYALKTENDWGSGDYSGLNALADWVAEKGGKVVGTLPLLPIYPEAPSPYAPVSRLLWSEFYIDVTQAPEFAGCSWAREMAEAFKQEIQELKQLRLVDYRRVMELKRKIMEAMSYYVDTSELQRYNLENPIAAEYARFRAVMEKQQKPWGQWPGRLRERNLRSADYDEDVRNYHLYAQRLAAEQVKKLAEKSIKKGIGLYLDLPLGTHPDGYDTWRYRDVFMSEISTGAPPDPVFTNGQNWGFPPLHPEKIREHGYLYVREYLCHHLQYARMLRIDHVMGLHRLYYIPCGIDAGQGVYVNYRAEEMYAILTLESHRHKSIIVGEDLGIVPGYVRSTMAQHGLHRMYILYYELADNTAHTPRPVPAKCVAGLNTHDMPPFAAFWEGEDINESVKLGLLEKKEVIAEKNNRAVTKRTLVKFLTRNRFLKRSEVSIKAALKACLQFLCASQAQTVLINLEDLWEESKTQNVPGVGEKFPSFRRKARHALTQFCRLKEVNDILKAIKRVR